MKLDPESARLLSTARIGMLALSEGRYPLVNPAAFHYGGDSVWLTTSRHAAKIALARKRPEASFLVDGRSHSVLLEGSVEVYDPHTNTFSAAGQNQSVVPSASQDSLP